MSDARVTEPHALWVRRLSEVAHEQENAYSQFFFWVDDARSTLDKDLAKISEKHGLVMAMREDLSVLVRNTQGAPVTTYHSVDHPCGRVTGQARSLASFDELLEGEALSRKLRKCSACHWPVATIS